MQLKRRGDHRIQSNGIWGGIIAFQCPWAHPVWSEYLLLVFDLTSPPPQGFTTFKCDPTATHEFHLHALDPASPVDFDVNLYDQKKISPLTPANHAYQFVATSNDVAWARVNSIVDLCYKEVAPGIMELNPDTDFIFQWDQIMKYGWTLREK